MGDVVVVGERAVVDLPHAVANMVTVARAIVLHSDALGRSSFTMLGLDDSYGNGVPDWLLDGFRRPIPGCPRSRLRLRWGVCIPDYALPEDALFVRSALTPPYPASIQRAGDTTGSRMTASAIGTPTQPNKSSPKNVNPAPIAPTTLPTVAVMTFRPGPPLYPGGYLFASAQPTGGLARSSSQAMHLSVGGMTAFR